MTVRSSLLQLHTNKQVSYSYLLFFVTAIWNNVSMFQWFIVSHDSANKPKHHKSHRMQYANH